jgi:hypothetical protein
MKLKTGYADLSALQAVDLGDSVGLAMTGKPIWAALAATVAALGGEVAAVRSALLLTGPGASQQVQDTTATLADGLGNLADAANKTVGATDADLAATTFPPVKHRVQLTSEPDAPQNLRLKHGLMPGDVDGMVDAMGGNIRSFEGQSALDPNGPWSEIVVFPNSRALNFKALARGKDTWFRVRARNTVGAGPWCDPATIMVT